MTEEVGLRARAFIHQFQEPALAAGDHGALGTQTATAVREAPDTDPRHAVLGTQTATFVHSEAPDSDPRHVLAGTMTFTEVKREAPDPDPRGLRSYDIVPLPA